MIQLELHHILFALFLWVLSGDLVCYGAASAQILAIYENFRVFAVSVLLLANPLF